MSELLKNTNLIAFADYVHTQFRLASDMAANALTLYQALTASQALTEEERNEAEAILCAEPPLLVLAKAGCETMPEPEQKREPVIEPIRQYVRQEHILSRCGKLQIPEAACLETVKEITRDKAFLPTQEYYAAFDQAMTARGYGAALTQRGMRYYAYRYGLKKQRHNCATSEGRHTSFSGFGRA